MTKFDYELMILSFSSITVQFSVLLTGIMLFFVKCYVTKEKYVPLKESLFGANVLGLCLITACFILMYTNRHFFFNENDTYSQFFPYLRLAIEAISNFQLPLFNPYQGGGVPVLSLGYYGLTYPISYISGFLSNVFSGTYDYTLEIFGVSHFILGVYFTRKVALLFSNNIVFSTIASIAFVFSGYNLIAGASWYYMIPPVLWFPFCLYFLLKYLENTEPKKIYLFLFGILMSFHSGNVQVWFYSSFILFSILFIFLIKDKKIKEIKLVLNSIILSFILILPFVLVQMIETKGLQRNAIGEGILKGFLGLLFPYPLNRSIDPNNWNASHLMNQLYHMNTFLIAIFVVGFIPIFIKTKSLLIRIFVILAILSFVYALGNEGMLWTLTSKIPLIKKFQLPHKILFFLNFFVMLASVAIYKKFSFYLNKPLRWVLYLGMTVGLLTHVFTSYETHTNYHHSEDRTLYAPLNKELNSILKNARGRVVGITYHSFANAKYYSYSLVQNFATIYKIKSLNIYDHLVEHRLGYTMKTLKANNAQYLLQYIGKTRDGRVNLDTLDHFCNKEKDCFLKYEDQFVRLYELTTFDPDVYFKSDLLQRVPSVWDYSGVEVITNNMTGSLVINTAYRENFKAYGIKESGEIKKLVPIKNNWYKVELNLLDAFSKIKLVYDPPYMKVFLITIMLVIVLLTLNRFIFTIFGKKEKEYLISHK